MDSETTSIASLEPKEEVIPPTMTEGFRAPSEDDQAVSTSESTHSGHAPSQTSGKLTRQQKKAITMADQKKAKEEKERIHKQQQIMMRPLKVKDMQMIALNVHFILGKVFHDINDKIDKLYFLFDYLESKGIQVSKEEFDSYIESAIAATKMTEEEVKNTVQEQLEAEPEETQPLPSEL